MTDPFLDGGDLGSRPRTAHERAEDGRMWLAIAAWLWGIAVGVALMLVLA